MALTELLLPLLRSSEGVFLRLLEVCDSAGDGGFEEGFEAVEEPGEDRLEAGCFFSGTTCSSIISEKCNIY